MPKDESKYIGARVPVRIVNKLKKLCTMRGEDVADFIRRSVYTEMAEMGYLSEQEKKALCVK